MSFDERLERMKQAWRSLAQMLFMLAVVLVLNIEHRRHIRKQRRAIKRQIRATIKRLKGRR